MTNSLAALRWLVDMGVDEAIGEVALDRFAPRPAAEQPPTLTLPHKGGGEMKEARASLSAPSPPSATTPSASRGVGEGRGGGPPPRPATVVPLVTNAAQDAHRLAQAARDLAELESALRAFDGCVLKHTATNLVFGDGNPAAKVMLVGEAPGADEDRAGKPFVGVSGQLLDRMLAWIGLDRSSFYITNQVYWRPPGNRKPTDAEVAACNPFVMRHIELVAPKLLLVVGGAATKTLLGRTEGIMKLHGRWFEYGSPGLPQPIPAMAIFHPAFLLRTPGYKRETWRDLLAIRERLGLL